MKEKFIVRRALDLYTLLLREKRELDEVVHAEALSGDSTPSWIMEVVGPGHTILLHNEAIATSEEGAALASMRNRAILIEDIFAQRDKGEQTIKACEAFIAGTEESLEFIKHNHAENLEKLTGDIIIATLVQNDIQRIEQLSSDLTRVLQEHKDATQRHQNAINHCAKLVFASSLTVTDNTLHQEFTLVEQSCTELMREMFEFTVEITERQLPIVPTKSEDISTVHDNSGSDTPEQPSLVSEKSEGIVSESEPGELRVTDISRVAENSGSEVSEGKVKAEEEAILPEENSTILREEFFILEEIDVPEISSSDEEYSRKSSGRSEKSSSSIQLHESESIHEYAQQVIVSLRHWDRPEKSDLLGPFINYRAERTRAIKFLVHQLALSLALDHPEEEIELLYRWIEICRGKSPQNRLFSSKPFDQKALDEIQQDPVLREIYFKLPRCLQLDLSHKAEEYAEKTGVINSTRSIDDPGLNEDQISGQWLRFIHQEYDAINGLPVESSQYRLYTLMRNLSDAIYLRDNIDDETVSLWKKQLKAAYKMYETVKGVPSEERLLTQEPLTEAEYQLIQTHASFKPIFIALGKSKDNEVQEKLRQERYKSILLNVLAGKTASTPGLLNIHGNLSHDTQLKDDFLVQGGESESVRGFRFLVKQDFFQYQLKYEADEKLIGILQNKGFSPSEARSVLGFMREQVVYSIFTYLLTARAQAVTDQVYMVKGMPHYIHIYKENSKIYFEVNSSPWTFFHVDNETSFPLQPKQEAPSIFYDAEFRLKYELCPGKTVSEDSLQLVEVRTDTPASWTLLNFDSQRWRALPIVERHIIAVDKVMINLSDADPVKQQQAKRAIEAWLSDELNTLHLEDYRLIYQHLNSIIKVDCLSFVIGQEWLERNLLACKLKIGACIEEQKLRGDERPQYVFPDALIPFDVQETGHHLTSQVPDRVAEAKDRIEQFLSLEKPSIDQCEELRIFLQSILSTMLVERTISLSNINDDGSSVQDKELDRLWLQTQIIICNKHIADAANDAFNVQMVVSELMAGQTQNSAQQKITKFLDGPIIEPAKCQLLADQLTTFRLAVRAKGAASGVLDNDLIQWLNMEIKRACGMRMEKEYSAIESPAAGLQQNSQPSPVPVAQISHVSATAPLGRRTQVNESMAELMRRMSTTIFSITRHKGKGSSSAQTQRKEFEGGPS